MAKFFERVKNFFEIPKSNEAVEKVRIDLENIKKRVYKTDGMDLYWNKLKDKFFNLCANNDTTLDFNEIVDTMDRVYAECFADIEKERGENNE